MQLGNFRLFPLHRCKEVVCDIVHNHWFSWLFGALEFHHTFNHNSVISGLKLFTFVDNLKVSDQVSPCVCNAYGLLDCIPVHLHWALVVDQMSCWWCRNVIHSTDLQHPLSTWWRHQILEIDGRSDLWVWLFANKLLYSLLTALIIVNDDLVTAWYPLQCSTVHTAPLSVSASLYYNIWSAYCSMRELAVFCT